MTPVDAWVWWLIAAVGLGIPLVVTAMPEFGMFAVGAVAGAVAAGLGGGIVAQVLVFVVVSVALHRRRTADRRPQPRQRPELRSGVDALKGRQAVVLERVDGGAAAGSSSPARSGRPARSTQDRAFEPGQQVDVVEIEGATAVVM